MRITDNMIHNNLVASLQSNLQHTAALENEASTGMKVNQPSDDPATAQQILYYKQKLSENQQYLRNAGMALPSLQAADSTLGSMGDVLIRAKELALEMVNGTQTAGARATAAEEVKQLKEQMVTLGNTQVAGNYIFGGYRTDQPPFDTTPVNNPGPPADPLNGTPVGTYLGTQDTVKLEIDRGVYMPVNYPGSDLLNGGVPSGSTGTDVIGALDGLITALSNNDQAGISTQIGNLSAASTQVLSVRGEIGARENRLLAAQSSLQGVNVNIQQVISDKQDVDFPKLVSDLQQQQTAYQAILASAAKISQISLVDYLK